MTAAHRVIITCPSLDLKRNIGGISSVAGFVINNNTSYLYSHFELGKYDKEKRTIFYYSRILKGWIHWFFLMTFGKNLLVHFNIALEKRSIIRDSPLLFYAQLLRKRMVIHIHGGLYLTKEDMPRWIKSVIRFILSGREPKIVLSPDEKELIIRKFNAGNVFVLPNSLDINEAKVFNRIYPYTVPVKLLFIGRIVKDKGIEYIFQALKVLREKEIPFKFMMAGVGEDKDEYVRRFSDILGSYFEYRGVVSGDSKTALLKECNVFLLPSFYEGLPISLLECMSFALVPVVTNVGSIKNVITDGYNGIIIRKHSYEDISEAIARLINEKDLMEKLGANARQYIFENFNPGTYIKELNKIYDMA
ncbi:MAG: glycosyltransferase family 4 protein [Bacteroidales bacterium]|nr:glycosyltransferase family 4 protein [Bacteroidales bacterium]